MYKDVQGRRYESIFVGAHANTGEKYICFRRCADRTIWMLSLDDFRQRSLEDGKVIQRFREVTGTEEDV